MQDLHMPLSRVITSISAGAVGSCTASDSQHAAQATSPGRLRDICIIDYPLTIVIAAVKGYSRCAMKQRSSEPNT